MELQEKTVPQKKKSKVRFGIVIAVAFIALLVCYIFFRGEYLETLEIGENYVTVFWQDIGHKTITLITNFVIIYFMLYVTNKAIQKGLKEFFDKEKKEMPKLINKSISFVIAVLVSFLISDFIMKKMILCFHFSQFGILDPIFGIDIGYFVFIQPFIELVFSYFMVAIVVLTIYTAIYYIVTFNLFFDGIDREMLKNSMLVKQMIKNIKILCIIFSFFVLFKAQDIETQKFITLKDTESSYYLYGAGFTDVTIKLWGYRILAVIIIASVFVAIKAFNDKKTKKLILSLLVVPTYIIALLLVVVIFDSVFVSSNKFDKEKKYIQNNIEYTKNAYGINIEEVSLNDPETITTEGIKEHENVLGNIAIINEDLVLKEVKSNQTAKGYYTFRNTQVQKYKVNGKDSLFYITPREIADSTGTYNNKTYEYTHGYGSIITSATTTKEDGSLEILQKGFNEKNDVLAVSEPRIYYGLQTNDTVVTNSKDKTEFDYPLLTSSTADNATNSYNGKAGLKLNFIDRIIIAIKEGDLKLAFSGSVTDESKILTNRNIIKRAQTVMPYLMYDENPYMVVNEDGRQVWVLDAYTVSNSYPYSQKTTISNSLISKTEINYIRNSVKVLIDAYDGTTKFYITDRTDPIIMAYRNIYPDVFESLEENIPVDISSHFVYPEYLYNIQAEVVARYHNIQPDVLYRGDDIWDVATHNTGKVVTKTGTDIKPYYTMLKASNETSSNLGLILPYTPKNKQNLISYLVGSYDNGNSKLTIYKYQEDSNVLGPMQLDTQIEQDEQISKQIESLNVNGTKIIKNMIIVPLDHTLLYVEPIYQQYINETDSLPTLKKVVVASGTKVAIGDTLKAALTNLVSQYAVNIEVENTDNVKDLINAIVRANNNLSTSNQSNDWEMMGKDIQRLQALIQKLEEAAEKENETANSISTNAVTNSIEENTITNTIR